MMMSGREGSGVSEKCGTLRVFPVLLFSYISYRRGCLPVSKIYTASKAYPSIRDPSYARYSQLL